MSEHILKAHNKNFLLYHAVFPAKFRKRIFSEEVEKTLIEICNGIEQRYEIYFAEIGADENHVHFLVQSVPTWAPYRIVQCIKSITSKQIHRCHPEIKAVLWGTALWTGGYYINTVGQHGCEKVISEYVRNQGSEYEYKKIHSSQLRFF